MNERFAGSEKSCGWLLPNICLAFPGREARSIPHPGGGAQAAWAAVLKIQDAAAWRRLSEASPDASRVGVKLSHPTSMPRLRSASTLTLQGRAIAYDSRLAPVTSPLGARSARAIGNRPLPISAGILAKSETSDLACARTGRGVLAQQTRTDTPPPHPSPKGGGSSLPLACSQMRWPSPSVDTGCFRCRPMHGCRSREHPGSVGG